MSVDFYSGFLVGFVFATLLGLIFGQIQKARKRVGAHNRVQSVIVKTIKTPQEVRADHFKAVFEIMGWIALLVFMISSAIYFSI